MIWTLGLPTKVAVNILRPELTNQNEHDSWNWTVVDMSWSTLNPGRVRFPGLGWLAKKPNQSPKETAREREGGGEVRKSEAEEPAIVAEQRKGGRRKSQSVAVQGNIHNANRSQTGAH